MKDITNVTPQLKYDLKGLHQVVVQKGNVGLKYIYALQQLSKGTDTVVYKAPKNGLSTKFTKNGYRLYLNGINRGGTAGAHTQTWEYAGDTGNGEWFIGTKPKYDSKSEIEWASQVARVSFGNAVVKNNTDLTRLSALNRAGAGYLNSSDGNGVVYPGVDLVRSEAAVSPDYHWLMIATIDTAGAAHFGFYWLPDINSAFNNSAKGTNFPLDTFTCYYAFKINGFTSTVGSIQGFDIDNDKNIYISSEYGPKLNKEKTKYLVQPRYIYKIPRDIEGDTSKWERIDFNANNSYGNNSSVLERSGFLTEFESIQVVGTNDVYLTVSYHDTDTLTTLHSIIYEISW